MGRAPCCDKARVKRGAWSPEEDRNLKAYVQSHGTGGNWIALPQKAGLNRCGKSCRLRWLNYLRPDIKHGGYTEEEDDIICTLYKKIGSRWSLIASHLPGRTDNDVKNHWNTKLKKRLMAVQTSIPSSIHMISSSTLSSPSPKPPELATVKNEAHVSADFFLAQGSHGLVSEVLSFNPMLSVTEPPRQLSEASSSVTQENLIGSIDWSVNGDGGDGLFFSEFGFGSPRNHEFLDSYGAHEKMMISDMWGYS